MMTKTLRSALAMALLAPAFSPALAEETAAQTTPRYSVTETLVGSLLDDPATAAILKRMIPDTFANDLFQTMGRSLTLKAVQQYAPDELSDANLQKIQAEFDKLAEKK